MSRPATARPHIARMAPYALADFAIPRGQRLISLAQNESLRPPSPRVADAIGRGIAQLALYPDPDWTELRDVLSALHDIEPQSILCGAGSMELIQCLAHAWLDSTTTVVTTQYAYAFVNTVAQMTNATIRHVAEDSFTVSADRIIEAVDDDTAMVFLANPGNPTGTRIARDEIRRLRQNIPDATLLVIDEAYAEFSDQLDAPLFDLTQNTQTAVLRTFSKAYGLAGARVGWGVFEASIAEQLRKLLNPNNVSALSQIAATACARDHAYMLETCQQSRQLREQLFNDLTHAGICPPVSHTNFLLLPWSSTDRARRADKTLRDHGVVARNMAGYGLPHCQRVTIANAADMAIVTPVLLTAIGEVYSS